MLRYQHRFSYPFVCLIGVAGAAACSAAHDKEEVRTESSRLDDSKSQCKDLKTLLNGALAENAHLFSGETITTSVHEGMEKFDDRAIQGVGGNGRACADCHMASEKFQLTPAIVQSRWAALQKCRAVDPTADDPLFRAIDADDFRVNGQAANNFSTLRNFGLVRVTIPLPANGFIRLVDPATNQVSSETVADVWRSVPSINNVKL